MTRSSNTMFMTLLSRVIQSQVGLESHQYFWRSVSIYCEQAPAHTYTYRASRASRPLGKEKESNIKPSSERSVFTFKTQSYLIRYINITNYKISIATRNPKIKLVSIQPLERIQSRPIIIHSRRSEIHRASPPFRAIIMKNGIR